MIGAADIKSLGLRLKSSETIAGGGIRAYTGQFAKLAQEELGSQLVRFTALNDSYHKGTNSKHAIGQAFDFTVKDQSEAEASIKRLQDVAKKYGFTINTINEYANPSSGATGGHIHVSVLGYKGTADALKDAQAIVSIQSEAQDNLQKAQMSIVQQYMSDREKAEYDHQIRLGSIQEAFVNNTSALDKYTTLENIRYDEQLINFQKTEDEKTQKLQDELIERYNLFSKYTKSISDISLEARDYIQQVTDPLGYQWSQLQRQYDSDNTRLDQDYMGATDAAMKLPEVEDQNAALLEAHERYRQAKLDLDAVYTQKEIELNNQTYANNLTTMSSAFGSMADIVKGYAGESSSAYMALVSVQKAANLASVIMNGYTAISAAWASAPFPYNLPSVAMATAKTGVLQAALQAFTPSVSGYATGGHITGIGTSTSDSIPIMASNGEFMVKAAAVKALGLENLNYMNQTGRIPMGFADGGLIAPERMLDFQSPDLTKYIDARRESGSQQQVAPQPQNLQINNILDPSIVGDFMGTSSGTKVFMNFIKNNRSSIKAIIA